VKHTKYSKNSYGADVGVRCTGNLVPAAYLIKVCGAKFPTAE
jgi:hypothetical protein